MPDPELPEKKKRDRHGYVQPSRLAARAAKEAAKFEGTGNTNSVTQESDSDSGTNLSSKTPLATRIPFLPQGRKLSVQEVETIQKPFADSLESYFGYMDQYLWARQEKAGKSTGQAPIWGNLDDEEIAALTRVMMRFGQHNEVAAATVRGLVEGRDYVDAGMIFGPRLAMSRQIYIETQPPKQPRVRKA
jgi:hypothetical protein